LQFALLTRHRRGLGRPVDFARQQHAPRYDEEFPSQRDNRFAGANLRTPGRPHVSSRHGPLAAEAGATSIAHTRFQPARPASAAATDANPTARTISSSRGLLPPQPGQPCHPFLSSS
jgi:hypothetical protein